jgi:hypothetical protein
LPPSPSSPPVVRGQWRRRRGRGGGGARCGRSSSCCGCCSTRPRGCSPTRKVRVSLSPVRFASSVCCAVCRCGGFVGSSPPKPWLRMAPAAGRARVACSSFPAVGPVLSNGCWVNPTPHLDFPSGRDERGGAICGFGRANLNSLLFEIGVSANLPGQANPSCFRCEFSGGLTLRDRNSRVHQCRCRLRVPFGSYPPSDLTSFCCFALFLPVFFTIKKCIVETTGPGFFL